MATAPTRRTALPTRYRHYELRPSGENHPEDEASAGRQPNRADSRRRCKRANVGRKSSEGAGSGTSGPSRRGAERFPCETCGQTFDSGLKRTRHQFAHPGGASRPCPLQCSSCRRTFSSRLALAEHQARHENKMLYVCPTCGRQFRQNTGLWRHLRTHNPDAPRPRHPCAICGREFSRPDYLRAHSATHDHPHERSFVCQVCNRGFLQGSDLKRHRLVHSTECRFRCAVCERTFSDRSSRNRHQREHDPMQCYVCTMCGTTFKRTSKLRGHVTRMHGDSTVSELRPGTSSTGRATDGTAVVPSGPEAVTTESEEVSGVCASAIFDLSCGVAVLSDEMDNGLREVCKPSVSEERQPELETRGTSLLLRGEVSNGHPTSLETTGEIRALNCLALPHESNVEIPKFNRLSALSELTDGVQPSDEPVGALLEPGSPPLVEISSEKLASGDNLRMSGESTNELSASRNLASRGLPLPRQSIELADDDCPPSSGEPPAPPQPAGKLPEADTLDPAKACSGDSLKGDSTTTVGDRLEAVPGGVTDVLRRSLDDATEAPKIALAQDPSLPDGSCGAADFASFPDFGSQAYYDWLAGFASVCNLLSPPLDGRVFARVTQVLKTLGDALALPSGVLACRENFEILLGIWDDLRRLVGKHLGFVVAHLPA
ncbi:zinc finger protein 358-like isoform X2 [Ixodes scapularis]